MRYSTDDMRNYAADNTFDFGVKFAMKEAADEIDALRTALRHHVINNHYQPDLTGEVITGHSCDQCSGTWLPDQAEHHEPGCLAEIPSP